MSAKKSFKDNNPALQFISTAASEAQQAQEEPAAYSAYETHRAAGDPVSKRTQGKKGEKLPRMNMAFSPENYDHIQLMGRLVGCSATEYVNRLIAADREARGDVVEQALKLFKEVKGN